MATVGLLPRATAIVEFLLPGKSPEARPLDRDREYGVQIAIDGSSGAGDRFRSPLGDESWRELFETISRATDDEHPTRHQFNVVFDAGYQLYAALTRTSSALSTFLGAFGTARRLVIASDRAEIHRLPWEAMIDQRNRHVSQGDLSVVHAPGNGFRSTPKVSGELLRVAVHFGPKTEEATRSSVESIPLAGKVARGLTRLDTQAKTRAEFRTLLASQPSVDVVHVEAHGDNLSGEIALTADFSADPKQIANEIGPHLMVLFWSCYSGMMQSHGESPGSTLLEKGSHLVLGFATPLRYTAAGEIAKRMYGEVFDPRNGGDVETFLTRERARLFEHEPYGCVWASLNVWLRSPLDLTPALRAGPRLPAGVWNNSQPTQEGSDLGARIRGAVIGGPEVLELTQIAAELPSAIAAEIPGAVVRLDGDIRSRDLPQLGQGAAESPHPADRLLAFHDQLAAYPPSLILWSDVGERELILYHLLPDLARNTKLLLAMRGSYNDLAPVARQLLRPQSNGPGGVAQPNTTPTLEMLELLVDSGRMREAREIAGKLRPSIELSQGRDAAAYLRYLRAAFLIAVKVAEAESAEECVAALKGEAQRLISGSRQQQEFAFEALLLDANLQQRRGAHDQARLKYEAARTLADTALGDRDRGRVAQELAWAAAERNERALAENLYREAIRLLGGVAGSPDDRVWTSALGRALRDYADLIAKEDGRGAHAKQLLRRAMAIHALDGRYDQLAPALQTLGRVAAAARDWEAGEQALRTAVAMFLAAGNVPGWVSAMRGLAEIAEMQGFPEPARRILERVLERLRSKSNMDKEIGVVALDLARVLWRLGEFEAVVQSCKEADRALPLEMRERSLLSNLMRCAESLIPPVEEPSKRGEG